MGENEVGTYDIVFDQAIENFDGLARHASFSIIFKLKKRLVQFVTFVIAPL